MQFSTKGFRFKWFLLATSLSLLRRQWMVNTFHRSHSLFNNFWFCILLSSYLLFFKYLLSLRYWHRHIIIRFLPISLRKSRSLITELCKILFQFESFYYLFCFVLFFFFFSFSTFWSYISLNLFMVHFDFLLSRGYEWPFFLDFLMFFSNF